MRTPPSPFPQSCHIEEGEEEEKEEEEKEEEEAEDSFEVGGPLGPPCVPCDLLIPVTPPDPCVPPRRRRWRSRSCCPSRPGCTPGARPRWCCR